MTTLGTNENPAYARVPSNEDALIILNLCDEFGWKVSVSISPQQPVEVSDIFRLLETRTCKDLYRDIGRNDSCPCGSEKKFKKCCADKPISSKIIRPIHRFPKSSPPG